MLGPVRPRLYRRGKSLKDSNDHPCQIEVLTTPFAKKDCDQGLVHRDQACLLCFECYNIRR